jgi:hypothetical protein
MMLTEGLEKKMLELLYSGSERADKTSRIELRNLRSLKFRWCFSFAVSPLCIERASLGSSTVSRVDSVQAQRHGLAPGSQGTRRVYDENLTVAWIIDVNSPWYSQRNGALTAAK